MTTLIQRSFAGGEIAPALYARVDNIKYTTGLRTLRNFFVMRHGGATNRPGTGFVAEVKDSTKAVRLIPFAFNSSQTYMLEFGNLYMRVHKAGVQLTDTSKAITAATNANPCALTIVGHGYATGDEIAVAGITGAIGTYLNNRNFKVTVLGANSVSLSYMNGAAVDSTAFGAYTSGGTAGHVYEIATPYTTADLSSLQFVQSADVVTIVHPNYAPRELARTGDTAWTLSAITFAPEISRPGTGSGTAGAAGANTYRYKYTGISAETGEESLPGWNFRVSISTISQANPAVVTTSAAHNLQTGNMIKLLGTMAPYNQQECTVTVLTATTFQLDGVDSTGYPVFAGPPGAVYADIFLVLSAAAPTSAAPIVLSLTGISSAREYNIYRETNGVYGFVGVAYAPAVGSISFNDVGLPPDTTDQPQAARNPFAAAGDYPSAVAYYQQRLTFANTNNHPEKIYASRSGHFKNFTTSVPVQADDAVTFTIAGRQVNAVRHMIDLGKLLVFTQGGEWAIDGDVSGILKPGEINPKQYSYNGASSLPPIVIAGDVLYVQARGSVIRDLAYQNEAQGYRGNDLTVFSSHLVDGYTLVDWTYQQIPHSVVWAVRSDGVLIGLTYVKEHQIWAWHRHDTDGLVENVCSVPEGSEDALYLVVKRTINGRTVRYVERMKQRRISDVVDSIFMDASLSYDGRNTGSTTMSLSGGTLWNQDETLTLTASLSVFAASDVANQIFVDLYDAVTGKQTDRIRFTIDAYTSGTVVTGRPNKTVPAGLRSTATTHWAKAVSRITGLWHLEAKSLAIFADAFVVGSPNNAACTVYTVTNGSITLDKPYSVIHAGLPYISDLETLDIDSVQSETVSSRKKMIQKVTSHFESSRGGFYGASAPAAGADPLDGLFELKQRSTESNDDPVSLQTGTVDINVAGEWNSNGRVFVRQVDPLPMSLLALVPEGMVPFRGGAGG